MNPENNIPEMTLEESADFVLSFEQKIIFMEQDMAIANRTPVEIYTKQNNCYNSNEGQLASKIMRELCSSSKFLTTLSAKRKKFSLKYQERLNNFTSDERQKIDSARRAKDIYMTSLNSTKQNNELGDNSTQIHIPTKYLPLPAVHLIKAKIKKLSKFGGTPDFPDVFKWPENSERENMSFIAQICFSELPITLELGFPATGLLYFFYDLGNSFTSGIFWKVLFCKNEHISQKNTDGIPITFKSFTSKLARKQNELAFLLKSKIGCHHQLRGYPEALPSYPDMRIQCVESQGGNLEEWILLVQFAEDKDADFIWAEGGRAFFWIKKSDLANHNFENTVMIIQSL